MKLLKILNNLNSLEKNQFIKVINNLIEKSPNKTSIIEKAFENSNKDLKNSDNSVIVRIFNILIEEFQNNLTEELLSLNSQLDILIDIISKEGNACMKQDWFARLYEIELDNLKKEIEIFKNNIYDEVNVEDNLRNSQYKTYIECLKVAYGDDELYNSEPKITADENNLLKKLAEMLSLSLVEIKLLNYSILPLNKNNVDTIINELKQIGVLFYSKKNNSIYIADEIVSVLRKIRGKEISDKYLRRILRNLREPQINLICKKHKIDVKDTFENKVEKIINFGVSVMNIFSNDIHKDNVNLTEKKKFFNEFVENDLKVSRPIKGTLLEEKVQNLVEYFDELDKDEKVSISMDGYQKLLSDLNVIYPQIEDFLKRHYLLQEEKILNAEFLIDFNIKPRDILELLTNEVLQLITEKLNVKKRGDLVENIINHYKDSKNLLIENYINLANRDFNELKLSGLDLKDADIGLKFEEVTSQIFIELGLNVDEKLKSKLNTAKDKIDILVVENENEIIIVECKTAKDQQYNKFSSVSRQIKSYISLCEKNNLRVNKCLLIAPDFSDDFINDCGTDLELNLSLIKASTLYNILLHFKESKLKNFPTILLKRDVLINEERVKTALLK